MGYYVCDCALCDLPHAQREGWVRGEKRVAAFATTQETAKVEKDVHRQKGYSLYLRLYRRGETDPYNISPQISSLSDSGYYVCDMGCVYGMCLAEAQKDDYDNIRDQPDQHVDYSAVPIEPSEEFKVDGINFTLLHALCRWTR